MDGLNPAISHQSDDQDMGTEMVWPAERRDNADL